MWPPVVIGTMDDSIVKSGLEDEVCIAVGDSVCGAVSEGGAELDPVPSWEFAESDRLGLGVPEGLGDSVCCDLFEGLAALDSVPSWEFEALDWLEIGGLEGFDGSVCWGLIDGVTELDLPPPWGNRLD